MMGRFGKPIAERSREHQGGTTPAGWAFAIWGPLFAQGLYFAVRGASKDKISDPTLRKVGWLTAGAYAGDTVWQLYEQKEGLIGGLSESLPPPLHLQ